MHTNILGIKISAVNLSHALAQIGYWIEQKEKKYVNLCTVYTIMECRRNKELMNIVNASGMALPDGMPLAWLHHYYGHKDAGRVYGPDLMIALCEYSIPRGYRHYFYGGIGDVSLQLSDVMKNRYPELQIAGCYSPPMRKDVIQEDMQIIDSINNKNPDIIWVGLGTPKQDFWVARHRSLLTAPVLIAVGAAFDFHTGRVRQAPKWMQDHGLEWLFRLIMEPRRLAYRYFVYNPLFIMHILLQLTRIRKYDGGK